MNILDEAIIFAVKAHSGMKRKGKELPYIVHPIEAATIAATLTNDLEVIAAAVLHDVVEDTGVSLEQLKSSFGEKVARLVAFDSEDKMIELPPQETWEIRKQATLDILENSTYEEQIIVLSDKLSNIRAIYRDYLKEGDRLWARFNQKDKDKHKWYYSGVADRLNLLDNTCALKEYRELVAKVFG
ncbi:MAG TPA: HD domain-containing protein [Clostridia bacterium]|nr:HD domain-containing protein [Clostridia bacterium]